MENQIIVPFFKRKREGKNKSLTKSNETVKRFS